MSGYHSLIRLGAQSALMGFLLSGPVAVILVMVFHPQPPWISPDVFAAQYHPLQNLPYFLGFAIIAGMVLMASGHFLLSWKTNEKIQGSTMLALMSIIIFSVLITFNYIGQTTFVHHLAMDYRPEYAPLISGFSMSNPSSLSWALEMWGYAFLGIGTWLWVPLYRHAGRLLPFLLSGNGVISLISLVWTILDPHWVETKLGLALFMFWNLWMMALMMVLLRHYQKK